MKREEAQEVAELDVGNIITTEGAFFSGCFICLLLKGSIDKLSLSSEYRVPVTCFTTQVLLFNGEATDPHFIIVQFFFKRII